MFQLIRILLAIVASTGRARLSLQMEVAALRHQLALYQRGGRRPRISAADRLIWCVLAKLGTRCRSALCFVQPRTVVRWQKRRFRDYWRRLSPSDCPGRPAISSELRSLIRRMWASNPTWDSPRIVAELSRLGIEVAKSTVEKYRPRERKPPSQGST